MRRPMSHVLALVLALGSATGVAADSGDTVMIVSLSLLGVVLLFSFVLCIMLYVVVVARSLWL